MAFVPNEDGLFAGLQMKDNETGEESVLNADGSFIFIGLFVRTGWACLGYV